MFGAKMLSLMVQAGLFWHLHWFIFIYIHAYSGIVLWKATMAFGNDPIFKRKYIYGCCAPSSLYCVQRQISTNTWESGTIIRFEQQIWSCFVSILSSLFDDSVQADSLIFVRFIHSQHWCLRALRLGIRKQNKAAGSQTWLTWAADVMCEHMV